MFCFSAYIFWVALHNHKFFDIISETTTSTSFPKLSVLIPARNEESNIRTILQSLASQNYPNIEVIVLNDQSTDSTESICKELSTKHKFIRLINGTRPPENWLGKNWACHQLSRQSQAEFFLFLDADVHVTPNFVSSLMNQTIANDFQFVTVWPKQIFSGIIDRMAIQQVYFSVFSLLPVQWFTNHTAERFPEFWGKINNSMAAACGQCLLFSSDLYRQIGGHEAVKNEVVEDVLLAKLAKSIKARIGSFIGNDMISTQMYTGLNATFEGFRKNFFAGFSYHLPLFLSMGILQFLTVFLPSAIITVSFTTPQLVPTDTFVIAFLSIFLFWSARILAHKKFGFNMRDIFFQFLAIFWFWKLAIYSASDYFLQRPSSWKSRPVLIQPR